MFRSVLRAIRHNPAPPAPIDLRTIQEAAGEFFHLHDLMLRSRATNEAVIRSLCRTVYLGDHVAICQFLGRFRIFIDTRDIGLGIHLLTWGFWEMWHTEALMQLVKPGMKVVDAGANFGYFTILLADIVGPTGSVHAFEPNPDIAGHLRNSVSINGMGSRTTVHECALGDEDGPAALAIPPGDPGTARIVQLGSAAASVEVRSRRMDGMAELADADFIKIDIEGAEEGMWRGMERFLSGGRPVTIVLEFAAVRYRDAGAFLDDILSNGFSLEMIDPVAGIVPLTRDELLARPKIPDQLIVLRR